MSKTRIFFLSVAIFAFIANANAQDWFKSDEETFGNKAQPKSGTIITQTTPPKSLPEQQHTGKAYMSDNGKTIYYDRSKTSEDEKARLRVDALLKQQQLRQKQ